MELHSSVCSSDLETSLKLLYLGANPNFMHPEKGICPLHAAAMAGQSLQVELLIVYGANPAAMDIKKNTPDYYARMEGHMELANRIIECQFEVTDRIIYFLCHRKPQHASGEHFLQTEITENLFCSSENAKSKLQNLTNEQFENLIMDVYEEVDRQEAENVWKQLGSKMKGYSIPFLPFHPHYSLIRNQERQKLACLTSYQFSALLTDLFNEVKCRQFGVLRSFQSLNKEEPLYDSVAPEEDYVFVHSNLSFNKDKLDKELSSVSMSAEQITLENYTSIKNELSLARKRVLELSSSNEELKQEIRALQNLVQRLVLENKVALDSTAFKDYEFKTYLHSNSVNTRTWYPSHLSVNNKLAAKYHEKIMIYSNQITKSLQDLFSLAKQSQIEQLQIHANNVQCSVADISCVLQEQLIKVTEQLNQICQEEKPCITLLFECAYEIAKSTKSLIEIFENVL